MAWWNSGDTHGVHLGDSFLYAGSFENETFVSAVRLDLRQVPRGALMRSATLELTGLRDDRLNTSADGAAWTVQFLDPKVTKELFRSDFQALYNAPAAVTLFPSMTAKDLGVRRVNALSLDASARDWLSKQIADGNDTLIVRIAGPVTSAPSLFAWDSGSGQMTLGAGPRLVVALGPVPATLPPLPTRQMIVVTSTPTPANVMTVAANTLRATASARSGTATPAPYVFVTATPGSAFVIITYTPEPENGATATLQAAYATAIAVTTGTFTPIPTNAVTPIVVLPTPMPENVLTAAVQMVAATTDATRIGTPTPLPYNAVIATVTPTTLVVANTPRPLNAATAYAMAAIATAAALTTGTPTPLPPSAATPTLPPPTPLLVYLDDLPPMPSATPTKVPGSVIPAQLIGKILFTSDRDGEPKLFAFDPATGRLAYLTEQWPYNLAKDRQTRSPDGRQTLFVQDRLDTNPHVPGIFVRDNQYQTSRLLAPMNGWSYDPVFSPNGSRVAFVSAEPGNDEIYMIGTDGANLQRLTSNDWEWDKHPSFSPNGSQIVFWSNRETGRRQLWIMNVDGKNPRRLLNSNANDWNPVWVK